MSVQRNDNHEVFDREIGDVINLDYSERRLLNDDLVVKNEPWDNLNPQSSFHSIKPEPNSILSESKFQKIFFHVTKSSFLENEKIKNLTNENSSLRKQLEQFKSYFPTKLRQLDTDKEQYKGYNDMLKVSLKRTEDELKVERKKCEEVTREKKRLEDHLKKCEAFDKVQLIQKNSQLKDSLANVKDQNLDLRKELKTVTKRLKDAEDHISRKRRHGDIVINDERVDDRYNETDDEYTGNDVMHSRMVRIKPKERYHDGYQGLEMCEVLDQMSEDGSEKEDLNDNTEHQEAKFTVTGLIDTSLANCIRVMKNGKGMKRKLNSRKKKKMKNGRDPRPQSIS